MLDSVVEFITQAASSTAFIFCFCNLIIVIILVDLKPSLISFDQGSEVPHPTNTGKQGTSSKCLVNKNTPTQQAGEVSHAHEEVAEQKIGTEGNDDSCCNEEEEEEEEEGKDDELRRRVEEFIEKVNKGWKAEYLSTSSLL